MTNPPIGASPASGSLQAPDEPLREVIARIIDPSRWAVLDNYLAQMLRKYAGQDAGYDPDNFKDKASLAKADAILSALVVGGISSSASPSPLDAARHSSDETPAPSAAVKP